MRGRGVHGAGEDQLDYKEGPQRNGQALKKVSHLNPKHTEIIILQQCEAWLLTEVATFYS